MAATLPGMTVTTLFVPYHLDDFRPDLAGDLPAHLSLEEQALFALGCYHQRQENFGRAAAPTAVTDQTDSQAENQ